ncbi:hypothetical protein ACQKWADRAFT_304511 [Trichoderma austrokoningii]
MDLISDLNIARNSKQISLAYFRNYYPYSLAVRQVIMTFTQPNAISICPAMARKKLELHNYTSQASLHNTKRDIAFLTYTVATMRGSLRLQNGLRASRIYARSTTHFSPRPAASSRPATYTQPLRNTLHTSSSLLKSRSRSDRAPESPPPTSFNELDVLGSVPVPSTSVDVCMHDGFGLNSGITIEGGDGALLVGGEAFAWRPWEVRGERRLVNERGQFELPREAFGLFDMLWPRPDLLIIGVGRHNLPLSPQTRQHISELGMRVEMLDTRNAAAQFNLLATERGVSEVAAALIPIGWEEGVVVAP